MNEFAFIDYQKPIGVKDDHRTSSYRGHIFLDGSMSSSGKTNKVECKAFHRKNAMKDNLISEQTRNYARKNVDPDAICNPAVCGKKLQYMKEYEEFRLLAAPKPLQELKSIYHTDFRRQPLKESESPPQLQIQSAIKICHPVAIERTKPGYAKHFDTLATTSRLDYPPYTAEQQLGIAAKDNITYWTWIKQGAYLKKNPYPMKEPICDKTYSSKCTKRLHELETNQKRVPNFGLTTESRSNYKEPKGIDFKSSITRGEEISCDIEPIQKSTENNIYGSGYRLEKYINTGAKRRGS